MTRRRSVLLLPIALGLVGCRPRPGQDPTSAPSALWEIGSAAPAARELLASAESAIDARFGPMTWEDGDPERVVEQDGSCLYATVSRRCDAYVGGDRGTPAEIAATLTPVLEEHGWPALPRPEGDAGGWLSAESSHGGLVLSFRSKGHAEIAVSGPVHAEPCELPPTAS